MKIKIERCGDVLILPLPEEYIERYKLKEGDELDGDLFAIELEKRGYRRATSDEPSPG